MPNIKLKSNDDEVFTVDVEIAKASMTIKTMLEDLGLDENDEEPVRIHLFYKKHRIRFSHPVS